MTYNKGMHTSRDNALYDAYRWSRQGTVSIRIDDASRHSLEQAYENGWVMPVMGKGWGEVFLTEAGKVMGEELMAGETGITKKNK